MLLAAMYASDIDLQWSKFFTAFLVRAVAALKIMNSKNIKTYEGAR